MLKKDGTEIKKAVTDSAKSVTGYASVSQRVGRVANNGHGHNGNVITQMCPP